MTPSADLFDLIKALSTSEKRYFKIFASTMGGKEDSLYLKLFDEIDKMDVYDEVALIKRNKKEHFIKNLSGNKSYLFNSILRALLEFSGDKSVSIQGQFQIAAVEVLFQKGLFDPCLKLIRKGKEHALRYEDYDTFDSLCNWETRVLARNGDYVNVLKIIEEQIQISKKKIEILTYKKHSVAIYNLASAFDQNGSVENLKRLEEIAAFFLQKQPDISLGIVCHYYYYSSLSFYYEAKKNQEFRLLHCRNVFELFNQYPHFFKANERMYSSAVNNLCSALLAQGNLKETKEKINDLKAFLERSSNTLKTEWKASTLAKILTSEIVMHNMQENYDFASDLNIEVELFLADYKKYLAKEDLWEVCFNISFVLFMDKQYDKALDFTLEILNSRASKEWLKLYEICRLFVLMIYFEQGQHKLLINSIDSTQKYFKRKGVSSPVINQIMLYMKSIDKLDKGKKDLLKLKNLVENDLQTNPDSILIKINLKTWIERKEKEMAE